ncbi:hypothetical protein EES46_19210 [Streptomyces sp. ADI98-10]|nr:hypothetical protein EES46_19210 [Streptomyces sp. ADI98-10]
MWPPAPGPPPSPLPAPEPRLRAWTASSLLQTAGERARRAGLAATARFVVGDAAGLRFLAGAFDATRCEGRPRKLLVTFEDPEIRTSRALLR